MLVVVHLVTIGASPGPPGTTDIRRVAVHQLITTEGIGAEEGQRISYEQLVACGPYLDGCRGVIVTTVCAAGVLTLAMLHAGAYYLHGTRVEVETDIELRRALVEQDSAMA
jgi:hypothetical protein